MRVRAFVYTWCWILSLALLPVLGGCVSSSLDDGIFADIPVEQIPIPIDDVRNRPPVLVSINRAVNITSNGELDQGNENAAIEGVTGNVSASQDMTKVANEAANQQVTEQLQQLSERESLELEIQMTRLLVARARTPADKLRHQLRLSYLENQLTNLTGG